MKVDVYFNHACLIRMKLRVYMHSTPGLLLRYSLRRVHSEKQVIQELGTRPDVIDAAVGNIQTTK